MQEANGFSEEENCLEHVLSSMEQKSAKTRTELLEAQEEVTCLRIQVRDHSSKLLEVQRKLELEKQRVTELTGQKEELQLLHQLLSTELQGLREEVKTVQDNKVELWHTNFQQLLTYDEEMSEKEREIKVLCDRLHRTEMELATLKLEKLSEGTQSSVSQSIYGNCWVCARRSKCESFRSLWIRL